MMGRALFAKNDQEFSRVAMLARDKGLALIEQGQLAHGAAYFSRVAVMFPDVCRGYALLFGQIKELTERYRAQSACASDVTPKQRCLIIALSVWGDRYIDLLIRFFIPSLLSPNNLPALCRIRDVSFDIYTPAGSVSTIQASASYRELTRYAKVNFITFADELITTPEYHQPGYRYRIFGGFHHLSIEHARALKGDVICIAPDGVHSDGAFTNFARLIDEGYRAVLFTGMKAQAEALLPILDSMRDESTQALTLPSRLLVALNAAHVHHDFKRFVMTKGNRGIPPGLSIMFFPNSHGFNARCFHLFPIILAADAINDNVAFDYFTLDSNSLLRMFPTPESWKGIKIVQHSDDGLMLDLEYAHEEIAYPENEFTPGQLLRQLPGYRANHFWHFKHRIVYHTDDTIDAIGTYDRRPDGSLERRYLPVSSIVDMTDDELAAWFEVNRAKLSTGHD
jgi:hypothetical protein